MAENFLQRLARNPYAPIDGASVTQVDELGNGYDDWQNLIAPKFAQPQQTWGETALGVATAPARMATALAGSLSPYGQDGWQVPPAAQEGWNALTAVGDAYTQGMSEDEIRNRALGMAGFMMGGGGLAARPAGGTGMFAGRLAKTADQEALARAERLAAEGADRRAIWNETGWFQGPDSKWRFEIDDSGAAIAPWVWNRADETAGINIDSSIGGGLNHPAAWDAYPTIADGDMRLMRTLDGGSGAWSRDTNTAFVRGSSEPEARSVALHEIQHGIQGAEGFARGGNRGMFSPDDIAAERARVNTPEPNDWSSVGGGYGDAPDTDVALGLYKRLAGETEARNVQTRMNLSADERRATPPWETQDIPDADQIVRLYSNASKEGAIPAIVAGQEAKPIRAYHGAGAPIEGKFDPSRTKAGPHLHPRPYFADDPAEASGYALNRNQTLRADAQGAEATAPNVTPVDIYMQNPFDASAMRNFKQGGYDYEYIDPAEYARLIGREHTGVNKPTGHDALRDMWHQEMGRFMPRSARKYQGAEYGTPEYKIYNDAYGALYEPDTMRKAWDRVYKRLEKAGYDGLRKRDTISDYSDERSYTQLIPFKKGTVKSATTGETLFSNADSKPALLASGLDMGQEARLARAEKRYDTSMPWYHGTRAGGFDEFDPSLANSSSKTGVPDGAIVFSSSPENASTYAAFREDMFGDPKYGDGAAVMPVYLDKSTLDMVVDAKGAGWRDIEYNGQFYDANELAQIAKDLEYEGLLVRNVIDSKISHGAKPADTYFKFSPQGIRSVNAAFDPEKANSTNLLAANADSRPALLGSGQEQDNLEWLLPYLGR